MEVLSDCVAPAGYMSTWSLVDAGLPASHNQDVNESRTDRSLLLGNLECPSLLSSFCMFVIYGCSIFLLCCVLF